MASLSTSELKKSVADILQDADLTTLSSKKVRKKLEEQYDSDFSDRKEEIDKILMAMVTARENDKQSGNEDAESEEEKSDQGNSPHNSESEEEKEPPSKPAAKRKYEEETANDVVKNESNSESEKDVEDEEEEEEVVVEEKSPPPKKTKPPAKKNPKKEVKNDEVKSDNNSDKSDDDVDDEALARKLQEEERNSRSRAVKKNFNKKESVKKSSKSKGEGKPRKESVYSRKCVLSPDLADVVGAPEMARHEIVKKMWAVVRERDLFDPKNKQFVICDEQLQKVFGTKRVRMFKMMKYLKSHIKDQH